MKKRIIMWMLAALLPVMVWGQTEQLIDGIKYELNSSTKKASVVQGSTKVSGDLIIPETFNYGGTTYTVNLIDFMAFYNCTGITSISLPNTVYLISRGAFQGCTGLTSINLPSSLMYLYDAFEGCTGLTSIHIPANVFMIENECFSGCTGLTVMTVDNENEDYESPAGSNCIIKKETKELVAGCKTTVIPDGVTSIGDYAFRYMTDIVSVDIPSSVTSIGDFAFGNIDNLTSVVIPNSVETIGYAAFVWAKNLTEVTIGSGVKSIQLDAFGDCSQLKTVKMFTTTPPEITFPYDYDEEMDAFSSYGKPSLRSNITLYVPSTAVATYQADPYWGQFKEVLPLPNKCATPSITLVDGKVSCTCDTEDVTFKTTISRELTGNDVLVNGTYTIRVVASREGYEDSDPVDYTVDMTEETVTMEGDVNGDGVVNAADAVRVANIIMNNDGQVE
jgi:hypothetical protein